MLESTRQKQIKEKNLDSFNFSAVVLHPNTESLLIEKRNQLLKDKFNNFIPLFPLYGILDETDFSLELKKKYSAVSAASIKGIFESSSTLYFYGELILENSSVPFIIPFAIEKKTDSKDLLSVFNKSSLLMKELKSISIDLLSSEISFRSFQLADCHISKNEYRLYENFWIKSIT